MATSVVPIDSEFPSTVELVINDDTCVSTNSVINTDVDSLTDDGSTRFADFCANTNIVNGHEENDSLGDTKNLCVPGVVWQSKATLVSNAKRHVLLHEFTDVLKT